MRSGLRVLSPAETELFVFSNEWARSLVWGFPAPDYLKQREEAIERSIALLRSWLSAEQREQFDKHRYFIVRGSDTGERYRICYGDVAYNVHELDDQDAIVKRFCFVPQGSLAPGDVMLSQKILLERDELKARAIANRLSPDQTWWGGFQHA